MGVASEFAKDSGKKLPPTGTLTMTASKDFVKKLPGGGGSSMGAALGNKDFTKKAPGTSSGAGLTSKDSGAKKQPGTCPSAAGLVSKDCGKKPPVFSSPLGLVSKESGRKPLVTGVPIGLVTKESGKRFLGSNSPIGLVNKEISKKLLGAASPPGLVNKDLGKKLPVSGSPVGLVHKDTGKKYPGSDSPIGLVSKDLGKKLPLTSSPSGKLPVISSPSGLANKDSGKKLLGVTGPIGLVTKESAKKVLGAGVPPSLAVKDSGKKMAGASSPPGLTNKDSGALRADTGNVSSEPFKRFCSGSVINLDGPEPTAPLKDSGCIKTFEKHVLRQGKESIPEKLAAQRDVSGGGKEGACVQQEAPSPVEKGASDSTKHEKQLPVYCTSPDFRTAGGASDLSTAKSPFSAVGEGNLPSPSPAASVTALTRSPTSTLAQLASNPTYLNNPPELLERISEPISKTPFATDCARSATSRLSNPGSHTTGKGIARELNDSKAAHPDPPKPTPAVEHEFVKHQLPKLNKSGSMPSLALLHNVDKESGTFYSPHMQASSRCVSDELLPKMFKSKRGRSKPKEMPHLEGPPKRTLKIPASKVFSVQSKEEQEPPVLHPEVEIPSLRQSLAEHAFPKKRGRPKRLIRSGLTMKPPVLSVAPFVTTDNSEMLEPESDQQQSKDFFEKTDQFGGQEELGKTNAGDASDLEVEPDRKETKRNNGQLMKTIIRKINKMKTIKRKKLLNQILLSSAAEPNKGKVQSKLHTTVSTLAATFSSKLGQQINVSKKGTIYIGKRRGRKPKAVLNGILGNSASLTILEKSAQQAGGTALGQGVPPLLTSAANNSEILSLPVCSQSSGVSGGQSPVSSDMGFVEPNSIPYLHLHSRQGSVAQTLAMRKASKARRRLSPPTLLPNSPSHMSELSSLKEATPSPISESHSDETIPSDSGIGTDNNSTSDRAEKFCGPKKRRHSFDHVSLVPPETSTVLSGLKEKHKHKCKRRSHDYLAYDKMKRQKRKRKKKYPQLRSRQDPDFLAELEELISRLSEFRITHRSHHFIPRDLLPTIFRINFNSFYTHPTFPLDPLHYIRKPDLKKKRGRPPKMREAMAEMPFMHSLSFPLSGTGFYPSYGMPYSPSPLTAAPIGLGYYGRYPPTLYPPPPSPSFTTPLPPPSYMHTGHLLLNPAKYHKKKHKLLRQEAFLTASRAPLLSMSTYHPSVPPEMAYGWMLEHKHRHRHKHREHRSSEQPQVSMEALAANGSSRTVLESLKRYRFGKEAVGERYKHKEKHRCHMACPHLSPSKGLLGREEQWVRREPAESNSLSLGLQTPLQIDCLDAPPSLPLGRFTPSSEPASSDEHTNLFTSAMGSCRSTGSSGSSGRKKLSDSSGLFSPQEAPLSRLLRKETLPPMEKALTILSVLRIGPVALLVDGNCMIQGRAMQQGPAEVLHSDCAEIKAHEAFFVSSGTEAA
uniref:Histone-Lysine N-Methyltransferase ash1l n=1 Tax=Sphaerodactylus townsendi TaxID=933632 RepID=A0ACB8G8R5_9SAUR